MARLVDRIQQRLAARVLRSRLLGRLLDGRPIVVDGKRLDPQAQRVIRLIELAGRPPFDALQPHQARAEYELMPGMCEDPPIPLAHIEDRHVPGPAGQIPIRIYRPNSADRMPALLYFHGGGYVIGSLDTHDGACRLLARDAGCVVVAVDYRLAPEHRFPAPLDDGLAAYRWVRRQASSLGLDEERIAVGGDSAGGNLSAVLCQETRDGDVPPPAYQLLIYPSTDHVGEYRSKQLFCNGYLLTSSMMTWFCDHYVDPHDRAHPRASPLRADDHRRLPPAHVQLAGFDPLLDEGLAYAEALRAAGVEVDLRCYDGLPHGYVQLTGVVGAARAAMADAATALRTALAGTATRVAS